MWLSYAADCLWELSREGLMEMLIEEGEELRRQKVNFIDLLMANLVESFS